MLPTGFQIWNMATLRSVPLDTKRAERTVLEETDTRWQGAALAESSMLAAIEVWG